MKAVSLQPAYWLAHDALFGFYRNYSDQPNRYELAVVHAMRVVELTPENAAAWNNLGTAYHSLEQYDAAKAAWDRALELEPTRTGYTNRGLQYYYEGLYSESAEMQRKATELAPSDHRAWGRLAESYRLMGGEDDSAGEAYSRAAQLAESTLEINSQDWRTQGMLATYYLHVGREIEAQAAIESSLANSERDPEMLLYAALVRVVLGEEDAALDAIEEMLERDATFRLYVAEDPDLQKLNGNPRFDQMMK